MADTQMQNDGTALLHMQLTLNTTPGQFAFYTRGDQWVARCYGNRLYTPFIFDCKTQPSVQ